MSWTAVQILITAIIAVYATWIARGQWQANLKKLKMDRYDRRLHVYQAVMRFLNSVCENFHPEIDHLVAFRTATAEADFLFPEDVTDYLEKLFSSATELRRDSAWYDRALTGHPPTHRDQAAITDSMHKNSDWLLQQVTEAVNVFRPYLDLNDPREHREAKRRRAEVRPS